MSHLVHCRGRGWLLLLEPHFSRFWVSLDSHRRKTCLLNWNAIPTFEGRKAKHPWPGAPAWLPIAWLCCEIDPREGPKFAEAILDAESGDDAPALIACDWLEGRGSRGKMRAIGVDEDRLDEKIAALPPGWTESSRWEGHSSPPSDRGITFNLIFDGPLDAWCRNLIATYCVGCGGRRDGEASISLEFIRGPSHSPESVPLARSQLAEFRATFPDAILQLSACPLCGFPTPVIPGSIGIPEMTEGLRP